MNEESLSIGWMVREPPLPPSAAVARGAAARALARRVLGRSDAALARLRGVAARGLLLLLGEPEDLPWEDGVTYLGRDERAPSLLLPTTRAPGVPVALLERALIERAGAAPAPLAVLLDPPALVPTGAAREIARPRLAAWLAAEDPA